MLLAPAHPLATLIKAAGSRCAIAENFQASKGLAGLDEHQVRTWTSWHRWVTLAMLALAFLTITAATEHTRQHSPAQIPLTRNEIARLFTALAGQPARDPRHRLHWSAWGPGGQQDPQRPPGRRQYGAGRAGRRCGPRARPGLRRPGRIAAGAVAGPWWPPGPGDGLIVGLPAAGQSRPVRTGARNSPGQPRPGGHCVSPRPAASGSRRGRPRWRSPRSAAPAGQAGRR